MPSDLPLEESHQLLDSFDGPDQDFKTKNLSLSSLQSDEENSQEGLDTRLANNNQGPGQSAAHEIDRNIHDAILEGQSSRNEPDRTSVDLELQQAPGRLSTRQRIANVINHLVPIKQTYERINNGLATGRMQANTPGRFLGLGTDGVFRNLMAKPDTESNRVEQENFPPSYEEAAADASPEYWESTVISPMYEDEVFVQGLPVGNIANFVWNGLVSVAFQFVGFVLCYLLHTSHAAKHGSRTGLGMTFIFYGWAMVPSNFGNADKIPSRYEPNDPNLIDVSKSLTISSGGKLDNYVAGMFQQHAADSGSATADHGNEAPYFAYGLIAFGVFIILKALVDYYKVKQMEKVILCPPSTNTHPSTTTTTSETTFESPDGTSGR